MHNHQRLIHTHTFLKGDTRTHAIDKHIAMNPHHHISGEAEGRGVCVCVCDCVVKPAHVEDVTADFLLDSLAAWLVVWVFVCVCVFL